MPQNGACHRLGLSKLGEWRNGVGFELDSVQELISNSGEFALELRMQHLLSASSSVSAATILKGGFGLSVERHARKFNCWIQIVAMLCCQLGRAQSLREIGGRLADMERKPKRLGVRLAPTRSKLAYANQHRPWELFQTVFQQLLNRCQQEQRALGKKRKFGSAIHCW